MESFINGRQVIPFKKFGMVRVNIENCSEKVRRSESKPIALIFGRK